MKTAGPLNPESRTEHQRLVLVEQEQDPATIALFDRLGLCANWHCLEIGAGAGSITFWLAEHCPEGRVVAVDRKKQLPPASHPGVEFLHSDISSVEFAPESFHLIHARAVLTHVPDRESLVARLTSWLRAGGWLVVTDPASFPVESSPYPLMRKAGVAATAVVRAMFGTDPNWARTFPQPLIDAGLVDVDAECTLRMMRGGTREATMLGLTYEQLGPHMEATGLITPAELNEVRTLLRDDRYVDLPPAVIRSWGRRPGGNHVRD